MDHSKDLCRLEGGLMGEILSHFEKQVFAI
jgi:hypothetical protein